MFWHTWEEHWSIYQLFLCGSSSYSVGVGLYGQGCVDRQDLKQERQLALEGVFDFWSQGSGVVGYPLAQGPLGYPVVCDESVSFWVGSHPQLEELFKNNSCPYLEPCRNVLG